MSKQKLEFNELQIELANYLKAKPLNYSKLERLLQIPPTTLSKFTKGKRRLPKKHLRKLVVFFGLNEI